MLREPCSVLGGKLQAQLESSTMDVKILTLGSSLLASGIGLYFSIAYTARRLKSGKVVSHARQGGNRLRRETHSRAHAPLQYWFFLILYSLLLNGLVGAVFFVSLQGLFIQLQI